jgi:Carbohydrate binding domain
MVIALVLGMVLGGKSLVANGDFEDASLSPWRAFDLGGGTVWEIDRGQKHGGRSSLHVLRKSAAGKMDICRLDDLAVVAGREIAFSCWVQTKDAGRLRVAGYFSDAGGKQVGEEFGEVFTGTKKWTKFSHAARVPDEAVHLSLVMQMFQKGEAWIDDLEAVPQGESAGPLVNPSFEDGLKGWALDLASQEAAATADGRDHADGAAALRIERRGFVELVADRVSQRIDAELAGPFKVAVAARGENVRLARVQVRFYDGAGAYLGRETLQEITGTGKWTRAQKALTPKAGARSADLCVEMLGPGTLWVDDIRCEMK